MMSQEIAKTNGGGQAPLQVSNSGDTTPTNDAAVALAEVQAAMTIARSNPRDEDKAFQRVARSCQRTSFAERATYSFPRGGTTIKGPSVNLARELAAAWGNISYGTRVVHEDEDTRLIACYAWDVETNTRVGTQDLIEKKIQRKDKDGTTKWVVPDERDLRELTNRRAAISVRNCLLQLLPTDLVEDAVDACHRTIARQAKESPDQLRKQVLAGFATIGIPADQLRAFLGSPIEQATPNQLAELRQIYASIRDGNSKWGEYYVPGDAGEKETKEIILPTATGSADLDLLTADDQKDIMAGCEAAEIGITDLFAYLKDRYGSPLLATIPADEKNSIIEWITNGGNTVEDVEAAASTGENEGVESEDSAGTVSAATISNAEAHLQLMGMTRRDLNKHLRDRFDVGKLEDVPAEKADELIALLVSIYQDLQEEEAK